MSSLSASNIRDVSIYGKTPANKLDLCHTHQQSLCRKISGDINALVATTLFQTYFEDFLPADERDNLDVKIRVTQHSITVKTDTRHSLTVKLDEVDDLDQEEIDSVREINEQIIEKANQAYHNCKRAHNRHTHSQPPLRGRTSSIIHHSSPRRGRSESLSPRPRRHLSHSNEERNAHSIDSLRTHVNLLKDNTSRLRTGLNANPRLMDKLTHLETELHKIEEKIGCTAPSHNSSSVVEERINTILSRLNEMDQKINLLSSQPKMSPVSPRPTLEEKATQTDLEQIPLISTPHVDCETSSPVITSEQFAKLVKISEDLTAEPIASSTHLPWEIKEEFSALPKEVRNSIYYQTYLLIDPVFVPSELRWRVGERLFQEMNPEMLTMTNLSRAHAIRHLLTHSLSNEFAATLGSSPSSQLIIRFGQLPECDKNDVYIQLQFLQQRTGSEDTPVVAKDAFHEKNGKTATNKHRGEALNRVLLNRIAEYHHYLHQLNLEQATMAYQLALEEVKSKQ